MRDDSDGRYNHPCLTRNQTDIHYTCLHVFTHTYAQTHIYTHTCINTYTYRSWRQRAWRHSFLQSRRGVSIQERRSSVVQGTGASRFVRASVSCLVTRVCLKPTFKQCVRYQEAFDDKESNHSIHLIFAGSNPYTCSHTRYHSCNNTCSCTRIYINTGNWHSHHTLNLPVPSAGDNRTVQKTLREYGRENFCLVIATLSHDGATNAIPYVFTYRY